MIDVLEIDDFLDEATREEILAEMRAAAGAPATVLSQEAEGRVAPMVRRTTRIAVPEETRARVKQRLVELIPRLERHFGVKLGECEEPQFLRYGQGDFFVAHQDGNTPLVYDQSRFRRVSAVIFLSPRSDHPAPDTYGGGLLVFHGPYTRPGFRAAADATPGSLAAFRAETTHEVTPVTHGVRYTIAAFFRAAAADAVSLPEASRAPTLL